MKQLTSPQALVVLKHQYETFSIKENETIRSMINRVQTLLNSLLYKSMITKYYMNEKGVVDFAWRTQDTTLRTFKKETMSRGVGKHSYFSCTGYFRRLRKS